MQPGLQEVAHFGAAGGSGCWEVGGGGDGEVGWGGHDGRWGGVLCCEYVIGEEDVANIDR